MMREACEKAVADIPNFSRQQLESLYRGMLSAYADLWDSCENREKELRERENEFYRKVSELEKQLYLLGVTPCTRKGEATVWYYHFEHSNAPVAYTKPAKIIKMK